MNPQLFPRWANAPSLGYYGYTFATMHRFTNMSALLLITMVLIFLIGIVSERITALMYKDSGDLD